MPPAPGPSPCTMDHHERVKPIASQSTFCAGCYIFTSPSRCCRTCRGHARGRGAWAGRGGREAGDRDARRRNDRPRPAKTLTHASFSVFTFSRIFDCLTKHASLSPCATHTYTCLHHISHQAITQHSTDNTADPAQTSRTDEPSKPRTYSHENATAKHTSIIV